jgi:seryl-tRNA synthetase
MLQLAVLREQTDLVIQGLLKKHYKPAEIEVKAILALDQQRRSLQSEHDEAQARANTLARQIGGLMKSGALAEAETL